MNLTLNHWGTLAMIMQSMSMPLENEPLSSGIETTEPDNPAGPSGS